jgi:microcompartment protein CcmK/EutM
MKLCRVTGNIVSTVKNEKLQGKRLMCVQEVELDGTTPKGASFIAVDRSQAGISDLVLTIQEGGGCRILYNDKQTPIMAVIVAVVDDLEVHDWDGLVGASTYEHALAEGEA